jgi:glycosyltransferase involved in cell wall biosynthesis
MSDGDGERTPRVCLLGPAYPYRGGISHYNTCLAGELAKRYDTHIVNFTRLYPEFLFPGKTQFDESESALATPSERIVDSMNPFTWIRAGLRIARLRPDIVVVQWWHPYFALALFVICRIVRFMRGGRIVFVCHNVVPHERSFVDRLLSALAFSAAHAFVVQSIEDRDNLLARRARARVVVHPHPIYDFFRRSGVTREEARRRLGAGAGPKLLFFGYVRPYKGLLHLIAAMPEIGKRTGAELFIVGEFYEDRAPYDAMVRGHGLAGIVHFVDRYVDNEEVETFFVASDLVVLPYVSATQSGIVQIALAFDRPVVVTAVGGLPEVVTPGKTGFIVPPADPEALASAVIRFFEERWGERMAPHFAEERKRFSWGRMVDAIEGLVGSLPGGVPHGR